MEGRHVTNVSSSRLKEEFLRLLKEDEEFRYAVLGYLGIDELIRAMKTLQEEIAEHTRQIRTLQEEVRNLQEQVKNLQEQVAEHSRQVRALQEQVRELQRQVRDLQEQVKILQDQVKTLQEQVKIHGEILERHSRAIEKLIASVQAIGLRYGLVTEETFREAVKYLVEDLLKEYKVSRWIYYDSEGFVFGHPSVIEVDLLIRDGEHILVEYKASVDRADVAELYRIGKLYEKVTGIKPRLLIVSPGIRKRAKELADLLGVECRGEVLEV